ncbi:NACHT domain-containing NTPase [Streptomyces sp. Ru87]|uniref:NACHT domain-containing protein n=1 Tax=Streptomyces sp. Ru87 TaxID=2044307 RepID=UPI0015D49CAF|nr:ATP-binding protein [Streptomyces sp. Ru87]
MSRGALAFKDAVVLLGGDPPALAALDRALGGVLKTATGGVSDDVLNVLGARGRILGLGRDLLTGLRERLGSCGRAERTERLAAAHTVIVVVAYFEALERARLPFGLHEVRLTRDEQITLAGRGGPAEGSSRAFAEALASVAPPRPAPHRPYEEMATSLGHWYAHLSRRLLSFVEGLSVWDGLDDTARRAAADGMGAEVPRAAVERYEELYAELCGQAPEFAIWSWQTEHQATRAVLGRALSGVETLLEGLAARSAPADVAAALATAHRAALARPALETRASADGVCVPTLGDIYLEPGFRVRAVDGGGGPGDESWWEDAPLRTDLAGYLAGALTSDGLAAAPLLVLGQPGAGKSALTKVLAARLPAAGYLPVRVVLREAPAESDVQEQIEHAVRAATGERATWPELVRSAGGAVPVVLLDGFDELLQATGVNQTDYLVQVARFQQREAEQGRPVLALVTSRTAVADRARCPERTVALRLEPFRAEQTEQWLAVWNDTNGPYFAAHGLRPLPPEVVARHPALAAQPLLLMMLALYDSGRNALQQGGSRPSDGTPLDEAALYEELLASFAAREIDKAGEAYPGDGEAAHRVEEELQRLSLVAFAIHNRRRQWVTETELDADLAALLGSPTAGGAGFRAPLGHAQRTLGRFFFVQRAQAVRDDRTLTTYEFLHATFGEYLVARLAVQVLCALPGHRSALTVGPDLVDDELLYALLSFAPLSARQVPRFLRARTERLDPDERARLARLLPKVLAEKSERTAHDYAGYQPVRLATASRHGLYSANLVLLALCLTGTTTADELFPGSPDPAGEWHRQALLWRSALDQEQWADFALSMSMHRERDTDGHRHLAITLRVETGPSPEQPEPVDLHWHYEVPETAGGGPRGLVHWSRPYGQQIRHKLDVSGGTDNAVLRHTLDPVFDWIGPTVTSFAGRPGDPAVSGAHALLDLWFVSRLGRVGELRLGGSDVELTRAYSCCLAHLMTVRDSSTHRRMLTLVFDLLPSDAARLPADLVADLLWMAKDGYHPELLLPAASAALAALIAGPPVDQLDEISSALRDLTGEARSRNAGEGLAIWVEVHEAGLGHEVFGQGLDAVEWVTPRAMAQAPPALLHRAQHILRDRFRTSVRAEPPPPAPESATPPGPADS